MKVKVRQKKVRISHRSGTLRCTLQRNISYKEVVCKTGSFLSPFTNTSKTSGWTERYPLPPAPFFSILNWSSLEEKDLPVQNIKAITKEVICSFQTYLFGLHAYNAGFWSARHSPSCCEAKGLAAQL